MELVKIWCIAASYTGTGTSNESILALAIPPVISDTQGFVEFKQRKCDFFLGPSRQPAAPAPPPSAQPPGIDVAVLAQTIVAATAAAAVATATATQGSTGTSKNTLGEGRELEAGERAAIMGWSGETDKNYERKIWREMLGTKSLLVKRNALSKGMAKWAATHNLSINQIVLLSEQFFKDLLMCNMAHDEATASAAFLERGLSAQHCLLVTREYIGRETARETALGESVNTRTFSEAFTNQKRAPRAPPRTLEELKLAVATYAALLWVLFGDACDFYQQVLAFRLAFDMPAVQFKPQCYTATICMGYWFEILTKAREFFFIRMTEDEVGETCPKFPKSTLAVSIPQILRGVGIENGDFPMQWLTIPASNATGGGIVPGIPNDGNNYGMWEMAGAPPPFSKGVDHCHPIVKKEFKDYHAAFGGNTRLMGLMEKSNITLTKLPYIHSFIVNGKNTLCYSNVIGICTSPKCERQHPHSHQLDDAFVTELCRVTKTGRDYMVRNAADFAGEQRKRPRVEGRRNGGRGGSGGRENGGGKEKNGG